MFLPLILVVKLSPGLWGLAVSEKAEIKYLDNQFVFCVTSLDTSTLSRSRRIVGDMMASSLVNSINTVDHRVRLSDEISYYKNTEWAKAREEAAKKIAAKQEERALLIFKGDPSWKFRKDVKALDDSLVELRKTYNKADAYAPLVEEIPEFVFTEGNKNGSFPKPPEEGKEYQFCVSQKVDAFLSGKITEFHNRIYVALRIYARYKGDYIFEDTSIFSPEDLNMAVDEIAGRLTAALEGKAPAAIEVAVEPPEAAIVVDQHFAGRGKTEILDKRPGKSSVTVYAPGYETETFAVDLERGELLSMQINLTPLALSALNIRSGWFGGQKLYRGSLYIGNAPMQVDVPRDEYEYFMIEDERKYSRGAVIFNDGSYTGPVRTMDLEPMKPKADKAVDAARRHFYWAYGALWLVVPAAVLVTGLSDSYVRAYNSAATMDLYETANNFYWASIGVQAAAVGVGVLGVGSMLIRYLYTSTVNEPTLRKLQ